MSIAAQPSTNDVDPLFGASIKAYLGVHRKMAAKAKTFPRNINPPLSTPLDKL